MYLFLYYLLTHPLIVAIGRSIDVGSRPEGKDAIPTKDWLRFFARPGISITQSFL